MRRVALLILIAAGLCTGVQARTFSDRFEEIKRAAPAELYTFLYALPKGGDLHNHLGGAVRSEWWYDVATDPARNGGDVFYTRVRFSAGVATGAPLVLFRTIRRYAFDRLPAADQAD
jgi:adenosine deaminase CECR1